MSSIQKPYSPPGGFSLGALASGFEVSSAIRRRESFRCRPVYAVWMVGKRSVAKAAFIFVGFLQVLALFCPALSQASFTFTNDPLTSQVTPVKAVHITELRQAINTLRSRNGLAAFGFTDPTLTAGVTQVRAVHITDLRTALNPVYDALGRARPSYTDPTISAGQRVIKKVHIEEIRSAVRTADLFTLTVNRSGAGSGTVTSSPAGISCGSTCSASFNSGTSVTLTASAASGSVFAGWSGGGCSGTGTCTVTMNAARSVTATFNTQAFTLAVTRAGTGTGTVASSPSGINCPTTCSATFTSGTSVTLTATPASSSTFAGWSGACTGTGTCSVTMNAPRSATATFNTTSPQITTLSAPSAAPAQLVTVTGSGFDTTAQLSVRFSDAQGRSVDVPVVASSATSLTVSVPPFVNPTSGQIGPGTVNVQVIQRIGGTTLNSNTIPGFQIQDLATPVAPAGTVTLSFLRAARNQALALQSEGLSTTLNAALSTQITNLDNLIAQVQSVRGTSSTFSLGSIRGIPVTIGASNLLDTDRMIIGMLSALGTASAGTPALSSADMLLAQQAAEACMQAAGQAAGQAATTGDPQMGALIREFIVAPRITTQCANPQAINTAYLIVGGAGAVGLGILALVGAPALALALPTAALLYITVVGGAGEIAVGGALGQTTAGARELVQQGVERLDGVLRDMLTNQVLPETVGTLVGIFTGTRDLIQGFTQTVLPPPPACSFSISSTGQSFTGTSGTGSVSVTASTGCSWTAGSNAGFISITSGSSGSGNGTVTFSVQANTSSSRNGSMTIAGHAFTVTQAASNIQSNCCIINNGCPGETGTSCPTNCCCCPVGQRCCPDFTLGCCAAGSASLFEGIIRFAFGWMPFVSSYFDEPPKCESPPPQLGVATPVAALIQQEDSLRQTPATGRSPGAGSVQGM